MCICAGIFTSCQFISIHSNHDGFLLGHINIRLVFLQCHFRRPQAVEALGKRLGLEVRCQRPHVGLLQRAADVWLTARPKQPQEPPSAAALAQAAVGGARTPNVAAAAAALPALPAPPSPATEVDSEVDAPTEEAPPPVWPIPCTTHGCDRAGRLVFSFEGELRTGWLIVF